MILLYGLQIMLYTSRWPLVEESFPAPGVWKILFHRCWVPVTGKAQLQRSPSPAGGRLVAPGDLSEVGSLQLATQPGGPDPSAQPPGRSWRSQPPGVLWPGLSFRDPQPVSRETAPSHSRPSTSC